MEKELLDMAVESAAKTSEQHKLIGNKWDYFFPALIAGSGLGGITKREWFAGMAMAGLMDPSKECSLPTAELVALSVDTADALIKELSKG